VDQNESARFDVPGAFMAVTPTLRLSVTLFIVPAGVINTDPAVAIAFCPSPSTTRSSRSSFVSIGPGVSNFATSSITIAIFAVGTGSSGSAFSTIFTCCSGNHSAEPVLVIGAHRVGVVRVWTRGGYDLSRIGRTIPRRRVTAPDAPLLSTQNILSGPRNTPL